MASPANNSRCMFLELPTEIRLMIYEDLVQSHSTQRLALIEGRILRYRTLADTTAVAITNVSRQIRTEAIPIIYRDFELRIFTRTAGDRHHARKWLNNIADAKILATVGTIAFYPLRYHNSRVEIDVAHATWPVSRTKCMECSRHFCAQRPRCSDLSVFCNQVEAQLELFRETSEDSKLCMTMALLESLISTVGTTGEVLQAKLR